MKRNRVTRPEVFTAIMVSFPDWKPFPWIYRRMRKRAIAWIGMLACMAVFASGAKAHAPHDVVHRVEVSPSFETDGIILAVVTLSDQNLFARSLDGGRSWTEYGSPVVDRYIERLVFSPNFDQDQTIFAGTAYGGLWRSLDRGLTWQKSSTPLRAPAIHDLDFSFDFAADGIALAATESGIYRSVDHGQTWTLAMTGITETAITVVRFVPGVEDQVFAGGETLHVSLDAGQTWTAVSSHVNPMKKLAVSPGFAQDQSLALLLDGADGIQASTNAGVSWVPMVTGLSDLETQDLAWAPDGTVFTVTATAGAFRADSLLGSWTLLDEGFEELSDQTNIHYRSVAPSPAFSTDGTVFVGSFEGFYYSLDRGDLWRQSDLYNQRLCRKLAFSPSYGEDRLLYAGNFGEGPMLWRGDLSKSPNPAAGAMPGLPARGTKVGKAQGKTPGSHQGVSVLPEPWADLGASIYSPWTSVLSLSPDFHQDGTLFYGYQGLWRSQDRGRHWTQVSIPVLIPRGFAISPAFATDRTLFMGSESEGTYLSVDAGAQWTAISGGLPLDLSTSVFRPSPDFAVDRTVYAASNNRGIWRSTDGGLSWTEVNSGLPFLNIRTLALSPDFSLDQMILAGTDGAGIFKSEDGGDSWTALNNGLPSGSENIIESIAFSPEFSTDRTLFVASLYDGVYRSTDGGASWQPAQAGLPIDAPRVIAVSPGFGRDGLVLLSTHDWIWRSRDRGENWTRLPGRNRVDDHHPALFHHGAWQRRTKSDAFALALTRSNESDSFEELQFYGDSIAWYAVKDESSGIAEIYLDETLEAVIDLYALSYQISAPLFEKTYPTSSWHKIRVRVTGTGNPAALDCQVQSDGFAFTF